MKKNEKNKTKNNAKIKKETEKIKEIIRRETGIYIKRMNSRNLKKEFEQFYYIMASNYHECLTAISSLDDIETQYFACIKDDYLSDFVSSMSGMMGKIFSDEAKVYDEKGNVVETLKTDRNGEATTSRLPIDQKYTIQETKTLQNYVLNDKKETVTLTQDQITNITFENEKIKGRIEITKVSKDDNQLTKEVAGTPLENAVFEIYTEKDELVDTITTAKDGKATSRLLEYGNYYVREKDTGSDYYLLNTEKYEIQIR